MLKQQMTMVLSPYLEIFNLVIAKDNILRRIKEMVDFSFIYDELVSIYCPNNGC